jgi:AraC family transcriptional regulator of adaptative response/methylated-DNA-[protein]-cysteine methyltransferase
MPASARSPRGCSTRRAGTRGSVWQTLLKIPVGKATTYQTVAEHLGRPTASRAVGAAVGKNPISFVVPCHRVVGSTGALTGYHWGVPRKRAILGWEAGVTGAL